MKLAGIAGLVAMLVFALPASAGRDETALERQVRKYLEPHDRFQQLFALPDDAHLGRVLCGRAGREDSLVCVITGSGRYRMTGAPDGSFSFQACQLGYSGFQGYRYEDDPCADEIDRG